MKTSTHSFRLSGLCLGLPGWAGTRTIWILLKQKTVSGRGSSWAICKSATEPRQITMPAPHHSVFTGRIPFLPPNQQCQSMWVPVAVRRVRKLLYPVTLPVNSPHHTHSFHRLSPTELTQFLWTTLITDQEGGLLSLSPNQQIVTRPNECLSYVQATMLDHWATGFTDFTAPVKLTIQKKNYPCSTAETVVYINVSFTQYREIDRKQKEKQIQCNAGLIKVQTTQAHNRFMALWILSRTTWVSWYQKKHSPTHTYKL